jgi:hypothetical protein
LKTNRPIGYIFGVLLILSFTTSCNKHYNAPVFVPRHDQYSYTGPIKHLYAFESNQLAYRADVIQIKTNNGQIDTVPNAYRQYNITPDRKGVVKLTVTHKITDKNKNIDTVTETIRFKAVTHPTILIKLDILKLKDSFDISYQLVYENTLQLVNNNKYQIGALPLDIEVYSDSTHVGEIAFFFEDQEIKDMLEKGNIICHPGFIIQDVKTELYFIANGFCYKYK